MYSTYPTVAQATPQLLIAVAMQAGQTPDEYRLGTLKRCDTEIANLLDDETLSAEWREIFTDLLRQVRIAIGDGHLTRV